MNIPKGEVDLGNCAKCPDVKHCVNEKVSLGIISGLSIRTALDPQLDEEADQVFELIKKTNLLEAIKEVSSSPITDGASLVVAYRQIVAQDVSLIDELIEASGQKIESLTTGCEGPLIMRARKAGRVVTATICNSPSKLDGSSDETVHLQRDRYFNQGSRLR